MAKAYYLPKVDIYSLLNIGHTNSI